jgi:hypothetical protein
LLAWLELALMPVEQYSSSKFALYLKGYVLPICALCDF